MITAKQARELTNKARNPDSEEIAKRQFPGIMENIGAEIEEATQEGADEIIWYYSIHRAYHRTMDVWVRLEPDVIDALIKKGYNVVAPSAVSLIISWKTPKKRKA